MTDVKPPEPPPCPRCGGPVGCGFGAATPCWCTAVTLDAADRAELARRYTGCLCSACLAAWRTGRDAATAPAPT